MGKNRKSNPDSSKQPKPSKPVPKKDKEPENLDTHIGDWVYYPGGSIAEKLTDEDMEYVLSHMTNNHPTLFRIEMKTDTFERQTNDIERNPHDFMDMHYHKEPPLKVGDTFKFTKKGGYIDKEINEPLTAFSSKFQATKEIADGYIWPGQGDKWVVYRLNGSPPNFDIYERGHHGYAQKEEFETWVDTRNNEFVVDKITENVNIKSAPDNLDTFVTVVDIHMV